MLKSRTGRKGRWWGQQLPSGWKQVSYGVTRDTVPRICDHWRWTGEKEARATPTFALDGAASVPHGTEQQVGR